MRRAYSYIQIKTITNQILNQKKINNQKIIIINQLKLKNFTSFNNLNINFSPKINIIINKNNTKKTHLLKTTYKLYTNTSFFKNTPNLNKTKLKTTLTTKFLHLFIPLNNKLKKIHLHKTKKHTNLTTQFTKKQKINTTFFNNSSKLSIKNSHNYTKYQTKPIFIPTKKILSLIKNITNKTHNQKTIKLIFNNNYINLTKTLTKSNNKNLNIQINQNPKLNSIIPQLINLINKHYQ